MSTTNFPNGVSSFGVPLPAGSIPATFGTYYFVDSATGSNGNLGLSATSAFASLAYAASVVPAGSTIVVAQGHAESVIAAAGIDFNNANVTVIGLGVGATRPTITFTTATTADMDIDAANIRISNFIFDLTGVDALAAPIDVNAINFTLDNSKVITASASAQATLAILTDANAGGMRLLNNEFLGSADAGTAAAVRIVGGNAHVIDGNYFHGNYTTTLGAIDNVTTATLRTRVSNNYIFNGTALSAVAMTFVATSTGIISGNKMQVLTGTAPIVGAAMSWVGANYYAAVIATAGTLI